MSILVNGELVDDALLRQEAAAIKVRLLEAMPEEDPVAREMRAREWAKENVIERILLRQAALSDPEPIPDELLERSINEMRSRSPGQSWCLFPAPEEDFRARVETGLRIDRLVARLTAKAAAPKNKDVTEYYHKHRDSFYAPEMVHAAHMVKNVGERTGEAAALEAIRHAQQELRQGKSFEEVADLYSDCPGRGGDLGFFSRGHMVEEFERAVFSLNVGEVSQIFRSPFGFHIAKLYERKAEGVRGLSEVRKEIEQVLFSSKKEKLVEQFVDELRAKADIRKAQMA